MKLTTGYDFQGYFITEYIDVFFDEMLVGIGFGKALLSSIDNVFSSLSGGEATAMIEKLNNVKAELRKRVISKAERAGANALIGIDFESSRLGELLMVSMTATAVKIEKIIEPLPLTAGTAAKMQEEKDLREKEELRAKQAEEWKEKVQNGEVCDTETLLQLLGAMDSPENMMAEVMNTRIHYPDVFTDDQIHTLEGWKKQEGLYGKSAAKNWFLRNVRGYIAKYEESRF